MVSRHGIWTLVYKDYNQQADLGIFANKTAIILHCEIFASLRRQLWAGGWALGCQIEC